MAALFGTQLMERFSHVVVELGVRLLLVFGDTPLRLFRFLLKAFVRSAIVSFHVITTRAFRSDRLAGYRRNVLMPAGCGELDDCHRRTQEHPSCYGTAIRAVRSFQAIVRRRNELNYDATDRALCVVGRHVRQLPTCTWRPCSDAQNQRAKFPVRWCSPPLRPGK